MQYADASLYLQHGDITGSTTNVMRSEQQIIQPEQRGKANQIEEERHQKNLRSKDHSVGNRSRELGGARYGSGEILQIFHMLTTQENREKTTPSQPAPQEQRKQ